MVNFYDACKPRHYYHDISKISAANNDTADRDAIEKQLEEQEK
jgi:hypothetical protein